MRIVFLLSLFAFQDVFASVTFSISPFNTTAAVGQNATLACIVSGLNKQTDKVKWKLTSTSNVLTQDSLSIAANRYQTVGKYNLTIANVVATDQGSYTCEVTGSTSTLASKQAYLTVVELPLNLTMYWTTKPKPGSTANLTCFAERAKPTPTFSWFKNEVQQNQHQYFKTRDRGLGYKDVHSTIQVPLVGSDKGSKFRCQADYVGWDRAMEYTITTVFAGSEVISSTLTLTLAAALTGIFL